MVILFTTVVAYLFFLNKLLYAQPNALTAYQKLWESHLKKFWYLRSSNTHHCRKSLLTNELLSQSYIIKGHC